MKESINQPYIIASVRNLIVGASLFFEGVNYERLKGNAIPVGTHLSAFLHNHERVASIHFREGLSQLTDSQNTPIAMTKKFLTGIDNDHRELARLMLDSSSPFFGVEVIWGLCGLSAKWGGRHGYQTVTWTNIKQLVGINEISISNKPSSGNLARPEPLTLFLQGRDSFIENFGIK